MNQHRHGDVWLEKIEALPDGARRVTREAGKTVLAHGEVTGHAHTIEEEWAELWEVEGRRILEVGDRPATLTHQEHAPQTIEPGLYEIRRQQEWSDADEPRQVAD